MTREDAELFAKTLLGDDPVPIRLRVAIVENLLHFDLQRPLTAEAIQELKRNRKQLLVEAFHRHWARQSS
jgi:hypothetical protein